MDSTTALIALLLVAAVAILALAALLACRDRELGRIARELDGRMPLGNARIALGVRSAGLAAIARAINGELDRECARRADDERAQRAFRQDLASLSHDIRTPLAGAQGYLQLAQRACCDADRRRYVEQAVTRLDAMRELVDGLFAYAKASDPALELDCRSVAVLPALSEVLVSFYPEFSARGWEPAIACPDEDVRAEADPEALARIFANLVNNALRHGAGAPVIVVEAPGGAGFGGSDASGSDAGLVHVRVENAVAHPERIDAARLFERFYKGDAARSGEGSGLGLAIVARLAAALGGGVAASVAEGRLSIELTLRRARG